MTRPKGSELVFLISNTPYRDARSIALEQSRARSHAARVSHPSAKSSQLAAKAKALQQARRLMQKGRHDSDSDTLSPEPMLRVIPVDTLYWLPYHKEATTYQAFDYFAKVVAPSLHPLYEILEITNPFTLFIFGFITESESFCHASIARLLSSIDEAQNHSIDATARLMTFHQTKAIRLLRQEVEKAIVPTNAMLATILYLIVNEVGLSVSLPRVDRADLHAVGRWPVRVGRHAQEAPY
ncbi:hypothetical protein H2200_012551 [Cladophialophora chaetospira]|uniref:Uncharacterized protein n=1 Tax=Cladophialophora chaetospira TaxID=386627 RepID=A0AA38WX44_9EURO|nr:hypothetical protein H2200_012551 [Cladophialophora chaetospira]